MILAEAITSPSTSEIGIFICCLLTLSGLAVNAVLLFKLLRNDSERREVTISPAVVGKPDFERHLEQNRHEHENLFSKIGGVERGMNARLEAAITANNDSRSKLHDRINEVVENTAEMKGSLAAFDTSFRNFTDMMANRK